MTADVFLWEGMVVYIDTRVKTRKATIDSTFKYNAPFASDKKESAKRGPFNEDKITFPAVVGLFFVRPTYFEEEDEDEEEEAEEVEEEGRGGGGSSSGTRRSSEQGGWEKKEGRGG